MSKTAAERRAFETATARKIEKPRILSSRFDDSLSAWKVDLAGTIPDGCSILKVVVPANDGKVSFKDREFTGKSVKLDRCIDAWSKETHENPRRQPEDEAEVPNLRNVDPRPVDFVDDAITSREPKRIG